VASEFTPRTASISGRETGCLYATMASVSSAGRESRTRVRARASRTSHGASSDRVTMRQPPPTSMIASPRSSAS